MDVPDYAHNLAKAFWPGALTLVVKASDEVGKDFRADDGTVGLRSPDHEVVMELIQASGGPLIATSANTSGQPAPGDFDTVEERILAAADVVLDGGETEHKQASTVVMCTGAEPEIVREGEVGGYHVWSRCVRRAFLCGIDPLAGKDYTDCRDWLRDSQQQLAGLCGIEIGFRAELSSHIV